MDRLVIELIVVSGVALYREGIAEALSRSAAFAVAGTAATPADATSLVDAHPGAVVVVDVSGPTGAAAVAALSTGRNDVRLVALGVADSPEEILACAEAGASGYLTRDGSLDELVGTIEDVARGELRCTPRIAAALMRQVAGLAAERRTWPVAPRLSRRELEIAHLLEAGLSNKEIASRLFITHATVKNHVHNILDKLAVNDRLEVAAWVRGQRLRAALGQPGATVGSESPRPPEHHRRSVRETA